MDYISLLHSNNIEGLKEYLKNYNINQKYKGQSLLHWAVHNNNFKFTTLLIHQGADVNEPDRIGRTPLMIACYFGFVRVASILLKNGADLAGCVERAKHGWNGHIQTEIIELLDYWERIY